MADNAQAYESLRHLISSFQNPSESIYFGKCLGFSEYGTYINNYILIDIRNVLEREKTKGISMSVFHLYI